MEKQTVARSGFSLVWRRRNQLLAGYGVENRASNHNRNAGHVIEKIIFSNRIWKNLLILEILFQGDAASYDSGEFGIVHDIAAGVVREVLFHDLFRNPAMPAANPVRVAASMIVFTSLFSDDMLIYFLNFFSIDRSNQIHFTKLFLEFKNLFLAFLNL